VLSENPDYGKAFRDVAIFAIYGVLKKKPEAIFPLYKLLGHVGKELGEECLQEARGALFKIYEALGGYDLDEAAQMVGNVNVTPETSEEEEYALAELVGSLMAHEHRGQSISRDGVVGVIDAVINGCPSRLRSLLGEVDGNVSGIISEILRILESRGQT